MKEHNPTELELEMETINSDSKDHDPNRFLRQKECGLWQLRTTIDRGSKYVGKRVTIGLRTHDVNEARSMRDFALHVINVTLKARDS